jgi:hypothetical protein
MDSSKITKLKKAILFYIPFEYNDNECTTIRNILKNDNNNLLDLDTLIQILKQLAVDYVYRNFSCSFIIRINAMILLLDGSQTYLGSYTSIGDVIQNVPEINKLANKARNELITLSKEELNTTTILESIEIIFS